MKAPGRSLATAALGMATLLTGVLAAPSTAPLQAQTPVQRVPTSRTPQPRSTANPFGGLRGNSERGRATIGSSSRGISGRTTARPQAPVVADEPVQTSGVLTPTSGPGATPPVARAPRPPAAPAARPRAPLDRQRPRLLRLRDGGVLRGRASLTHGRWKVQTAEGWMVIPEEDVRRADLESDILAMVKKRRRGRDHSDPAVRLDEARWMLDLGLATEALQQLDELLLRGDVEHDALALLESADLPPLLPGLDPALDPVDAMTQLMEFGKRSSPAVQELVISELVPHGARHRNELERMLEARRDTGDPKQAAFAERALRRLFPRTMPGG